MRTPLAFFALAAFLAPASAQLLYEEHKLAASDPESQAHFGIAVAFDSEFIVVGAYANDEAGHDAGAAYTFDASTGTELYKFFADDTGPNDRFALSVAIDDGVIAVGAYRHLHNNIRGGAVYLFDAATGNQIREIVPADLDDDDDFGRSIAMENGTLVIGAFGDDDNGTESGAVYIYDTLTGRRIHKLTPDDAAAGDGFGESVDIHYPFVVVGASTSDGQFSNSGAAYIFHAGTGAQIHKLTADDPDSFDLFGSAVAISNTLVAVAAIFEGESGENDGSVYLFDLATGTQQNKLLPPERPTAYPFARSIAMDDGVLAVSAKTSEGGAFSGSVFIFNAATTEPIAQLLASDGSPLASLGSSIAMRDRRLVAGASSDIAFDVMAGAAYTFDARALICPPDLTGEGFVDFFDLQAFLGAFASSDPLADWNDDSLWDFFDILAFLEAVANGCP